MLIKFLLLILTSLGCLANVLAVTVDGKLTIPDGSSAANLKITLNGEDYMTISRDDGSFSFDNVRTGIYLLDVLSIHHSFPQMKLKVNENSLEDSVNVVEYKYPGCKRIQSTYPLKLVALYPIEYYHIHPPFSIVSMITGNPMMLLMGFSLIMYVFFPKIMQGVDPEELQKLQEEYQQSGVGDPLSSLSKMVGMDSSVQDDAE